MQTLDPALLWFLLGFVLVLAEFAAPGIIIIFVGLGAWVVSLAVWLGFLPLHLIMLGVAVVLLRVRSMPAQPFWQAVKSSFKGSAS